MLYINAKIYIYIHLFSNAVLYQVWRPEVRRSWPWHTEGQVPGSPNFQVLILRMFTYVYFFFVIFLFFVY